MSFVTNVILACSSLHEDFQSKLSEVNAFFGERRGFELVDSPALPRHWYGGTHMLGVDLMIGAFNYLDLEGLIDHLKSLTWEDSGTVQLIVKGENDDGFRIITVGKSE